VVYLPTRALRGAATRLTIACRTTAHLGSSQARGPRSSLLKKIYVGNLPFTTTNADLRQLFAKHGDVSSASVVMDRESGRSRGFGFVEMEAANASSAIAALDGCDINGRSLRVSEAESRARR
jgi:RNA recognition motif-containing protein